MKHRNIFINALVLFSLILGACKPGSPSQSSLDGTNWLLVSLGGKPLVENTQPTLNFEDGKLNGIDGCNHFGGSYTPKGDQITFGEEMNTTLMACEEPVMQQADAFIDALLKSKTYQIAGEELTLLDAGGKALAVFTTKSQELSGSSWIVNSYHDGRESVVSVLAGSTVTAGFRADGRIVGSGGCNNYSTTYELSGQSLKIGPAVSTKMACADPAGVMEQEMQFLAALSSATAYQLSGDTLELRTAAGALAVSLVRAP